MAGKELKWLARVEGELDTFEQLLRLDMPFEWGRTVGRNVLEFESYSYHPLRRTFYWKVPNKAATNLEWARKNVVGSVEDAMSNKRMNTHELAATLEISQYLPGKLSITIERQTPVNAFMTARPMNAQEFTEWKQRPGNQHRRWGLTSTEGESCFVGWPWTEETERIVVYGRKVVSWLCDWLTDSFGAVVECTWGDSLPLMESMELKSPTGMYLTEEARRMMSDETRRAKPPAAEKTTRRAAGRPRDSVGDWAYAEYEKGKSIDDILPEYERRRAGDSLADPRESLRQAIETRKPRNAKK